MFVDFFFTDAPSPISRHLLAYPPYRTIEQKTALGSFCQFLKTVLNVIALFYIVLCIYIDI